MVHIKTFTFIMVLYHMLMILFCSIDNLNGCWAKVHQSVWVNNKKVDMGTGYKNKLI